MSILAPVDSVLCGSRLWCCLLEATTNAASDGISPIATLKRGASLGYTKAPEVAQAPSESYLPFG